MVVKKFTAYKEDLPQVMTRDFIGEFLEGLDVGTTVLVLTHCDQIDVSDSLVHTHLARYA